MPRISVETEYDKAINNLSLSKATCIWKQFQGICKGRDCNECSTGMMQNIMYDAMTVADRLAVDNQTLGYASRMIASIKKEREEEASKATLQILLAILCGVLLFLIL